MLVELGVVELRYQAVLEVVNQGATVTDVAVRFGVTRQTVHRWLRRYAAKGLAGLADGTAKPLSCPHQMPPELEARIVELRRLHPGWGPRTLSLPIGRQDRSGTNAEFIVGHVPNGEFEVRARQFAAATIATSRPA